MYIVTKGSDNGTFLVGDHIVMNGDGTITCFEAGGWIAAEDVSEAMKGMECKVDANYIEARKKLLRAELDRYDSLC